MIRLTGTGWAFLAAAFLLYGASLTSQSGLLLLLIGILLGCHGINALSARRVVRNVEIEPPKALSVEEGERPQEPWRVINRSGQAGGMIELWSKDQLVFRLAQLPGAAIGHARPEGAFKKRGVHRLEEFRLSSVYPFGLVRVNKRLRMDGEMIVYPKLYPAEAPLAAGHDLMVGGKLKGRSRSTSGSDFAGVRPMSPGDPIRQIHWKTSARRNELMVKLFDEEFSGRITFIIDPTGGGSEEQLDDCLRAAGSLMFAALDVGHHVEWVDLASNEKFLYPPFVDGGEILEKLARLTRRSAPLTAIELEEAASKASSRAALCFCLSAMDNALASAIRNLRVAGRRASVYLPQSLAAAPAVDQLDEVHFFGSDALVAPSCESHAIS